jgi:hypothetical protein
MPRFFDDYSNTYLTHDSSAGRKQQRRGWKFRENFRLHYEKHMMDWRRGPMGLASAQQGFIKARGKDDPAVPALPDGWREDLDEVTGISYYVEKATGKRTWVRPGFIPPPPGMPQGPRGPMPPPQNMMNMPPPMQMPPRGPPPPTMQQQQFPPPPGQFGGGPPPSQYGGAPPPFGGPPPPPSFVGGPPPPNLARPPPQGGGY